MTNCSNRLKGSRLHRLMSITQRKFALIFSITKMQMASRLLNKAAHSPNTSSRQSSSLLLTGSSFDQSNGNNYPHPIRLNLLLGALLKPLGAGTARLVMCVRPLLQEQQRPSAKRYEPLAMGLFGLRRGCCGSLCFEGFGCAALRGMQKV